MSYKHMYYKLFNAVSDAIHILQQAQKETEAIFLEGGVDSPRQQEDSPVDSAPPDSGATQCCPQTNATYSTDSVE